MREFVWQFGLENINILKTIVHFAMEFGSSVRSLHWITLNLYSAPLTFNMPPLPGQILTRRLENELLFYSTL